MNKMKKLLIAISSLALSVGAAVGVGLSVDKKADEANAEVVPTGKARVYFDVYDKLDWFDNGGDVARIHYWGGSSSSNWNGTNMNTLVCHYGRNVYYYDIPSNTSGIILGRCDPNKDDDANPDNRWDDNSFSSTSNFYQATGDGTYDKYTAYNVKLIIDQEIKYDFSVSGWGEYEPDTPDDLAEASFVGWYEDEECESTPYEARELTADLTLYAKFAANTHSITKSIWYDDTWQSSTTENVVHGASYTPHAPGNVVGYHFEGWYWRENNAFTTPVGTIASVTADDIVIHAKYVSRAEYIKTHDPDSYIYYVSDVAEAGDTNDSIYTFGGETEFGAFPGKYIPNYSTDVHGSLGFRGWAGSGMARKIYKIPFYSVFGDTHVKFSYDGGGQGKESANAALTSGAAYYWTQSGVEVNVDAGAAIDFLTKEETGAETIRIAVRQAQGAPADYSVCGISKQNATNLCTAYNTTLSETARGYVDASYTYTYNPNAKLDVDPLHQTSVSYSDIMEELAAIAGVSLVGHVSRYVPTTIAGEQSNNTTLIVIIAISAVSLLAIGGYFFIRRKQD